MDDGIYSIHAVTYPNTNSIGGSSLTPWLGMVERGPK